MIYEFKSQATGTITMTEKVGNQVLAVIGKSPAAQGIITVDQMPAAIAALQAAARTSREAEAAARQGQAPAPAPADDDRDADGDDDKGRDDAAVGLHQRILPFLEMLEMAHQAGRDVMWGV